MGWLVSLFLVVTQADTQFSPAYSQVPIHQKHPLLLHLPLWFSSLLRVQNINSLKPLSKHDVNNHKDEDTILRTLV